MKHTITLLTALLLTLPAVLIVFSYRAYTRSRDQQENMRLLHEVTSLLHSSDSQAALGDFLDSVRSAFRASQRQASPSNHLRRVVLRVSIGGQT